MSRPRAKSEADLKPLAGCTSGQAKDKLKVSAPFLQAYFAMRGPREEKSEDPFQKDDPLFGVLMARHNEETNSKRVWIKKMFNKRGESSDDLDLFNYIKDWYENEACAPAVSFDMKEFGSHDGVYEITRPAVEHFAIPADEDTAYHDLAQTIQKQRDEMIGGFFDSDDEDGIPMDGRISPCTFLALATGARRWDSDAPKPDTSSHVPLRPSTPEARSPPGQRWQRLIGIPQKDVQTGAALSDHVNTSINSPPHWDAEGVSPERYTTLSRPDMYDRMNPLGGRKLRDLVHGTPDNWGATETDNGETYGQREVDEAMENHIGPLFGNVQGANAGALLSHHQRLSALRTARVKELAREADEYDWRARELQRQQETLSRFVDQKERLEQQEAKSRRIKTHVAEQLRDMQYEADALARDEAEETSRRQDAGEEVRRLEENVGELCRRLGVDSYEEALALYDPAFQKP